MPLLFAAKTNPEFADCGTCLLVETVTAPETGTESLRTLRTPRPCPCVIRENRDNAVPSRRKGLQSERNVMWRADHSMKQVLAN